MKPFIGLVALLGGEAAAIWAIFGGTNFRIENWWVFAAGFVLSNVCAFIVKACDD